MLEIHLKVNNEDHGENAFSLESGLCDAYYSIADQYGDELHGAIVDRVIALIRNGHRQGGFLLGSQNLEVDFYAYEEA